MMRRSLPSALLGIALLLQPLAVVAVSTSVSSSPSLSSSNRNPTPCILDAYKALARQQRLSRVVLYGLKPAAQAGQNAIRYDKDGDAWIKTDGMWRSFVEGKTDAMSDAEMDGVTEADPAWESPFRTGIFRSRKRLPSELLPAIIQTQQALDCRLQSVCLAVRAGKTLPEKSAIDGCLPPKDFGIDAFPRCDFAGGATAAALLQAGQACMDAAAAIALREQRAAVLAVSYDSAYRSLLQFSGSFETFLRGFRTSFVVPLWRLNHLFSQLSRVPCFLSQCDR